MIAKVSRGSDGTGLVRYLFGPGRENEHVRQRVICSAAGVEVDTGRSLSREEVLDLGHQIDGPHAMFGTDVADGHVWHLSLTNPAGDRPLSDAEWSKIAEETVERLGFSEGPERAGCPWVAVGHGLSSAGNEHIHLAVSLVREDGTKASVWQDRVRLSEVCRQFERDYGLRVVEGRNREAMPSVSRAETELAAKRGRPEPDRVCLARQVRAASVAARDEAEFVRRLRAEGVMVRARFESGGTDRVAGYSVALRPAGPAAEPVWYGGGRLAKDLALPRLRERWEDRSPAVERRETQVRDPSWWARAAERTEGARRHLEGVAPGDTARWAGAARETAGVLAELSARLEPDGPGDLAWAADLLARSAQTDRSIRTAAGRAVTDGPVGDLRGVAMVAGQAHGTSGDAAQLTCELAAATGQIADAHRARGELHTAGQLDTAAAAVSSLGARWAGVRQAMPDGNLLSKAIGLDQADRSDEERSRRDTREQSRGFER